MLFIHLFMLDDARWRLVHAPWGGAVHPERVLSLADVPGLNCKQGYFTTSCAAPGLHCKHYPQKTTKELQASCTSPQSNITTRTCAVKTLFATWPSINNHLCMSSIYLVLMPAPTAEALFSTLPLAFALVRQIAWPRTGLQLQPFATHIDAEHP